MLDISSNPSFCSKMSNFAKNFSINTMSDVNPKSANMNRPPWRKNRKPKGDIKGKSDDQDKADTPGNINNKGKPQTKRKSHGKGKSDAKPAPKEKDITKDYKYQQIKKLTKKFSPVTINGISMANLCKQLQESDTRKALDDYLVTFIKSQPESSIYLSFIVAPSDPDFPFDLDVLKLNLCIPPHYPYTKTAKPSIYVLNEEIPRGYAVNIEIGFKRIVGIALNNDNEEEIELIDGKGLLSQIKTLDKYLEMFLRQEKKKTVKFVKGKKPISQAPSPSPDPASLPTSPSSSPIPSSTLLNKPSVDLTSSRGVTNEPIIEDPNRKVFIKQLNNKLKDNVKLFNKNSKFEKYKINLPINTKYELPETWINQGKLEILITIPKEYPNLPLVLNFSKIEFKSFQTNLIQNFNNFKFNNHNIVSILNYLSNNLSIFCLNRDEFLNYHKLYSLL